MLTPAAPESVDPASASACSSLTHPASSSVGDDGEEEGGTDEDLLFIPEGSTRHVAAPDVPAEFTAGLSDSEVSNLRSHCKYCLGLGHRGLFTDVQLRHTGIYLHALQYEVSSAC
jgi:hypothetical protein